MIESASGLVIRYNYLWAREYDRGEDAGRKARPVCVQILLRRGAATLVALFPISSRAPHADRTALEIPEIEARRVGLSLPSWIVIDEWNLDDLAVSPHVADTRPLGAFSTAFVRKVRLAAADRIRARKYRSVKRK